VTVEILEKRLRDMDQQLRDMTARALGAEAACRLKDLFLARSEQKYWYEVYNHSSDRLAFYRDEIERLEKVNRGE
jgi:hypothetical protein